MKPRPPPRESPATRNTRSRCGNCAKRFARRGRKPFAPRVTFPPSQALLGTELLARLCLAEPVESRIQSSTASAKQSFEGSSVPSSAWDGDELPQVFFL